MTFHVVNFSPQVKVKLTRWARGHSVMLIEVCMHIIVCNPEHISALDNSSPLVLLAALIF